VTGVVLLEGLLARDVVLRDRTATQLIGPGDIIDPWAPPDDLLPSEVSWTAQEPSVLAVLDVRFALVARRWPTLASVVHHRLSERANRLASQAAALQLPTVEMRILATMWQLAERFGRVGADGVTLQLRLTHQLIGRLVGARRSTVTLALGALAEAGDLHRRDDGTWVLNRESRDQLRPG
jgi:CRP-like cAMP-binding protein